jgi:ATP-dependent DNA helicase RecQ
LFRQLVARGLADIDLEGYGGLRLTDSCRPLLKGEVTLELRRDLKPQTTPRAARARPANWCAARSANSGKPCVPCDANWPKNTACRLTSSSPTPPCWKCSAASPPLAEMATVSGVGARKLERYGQAFLEVLGGQAEAPKVVADMRHELISLARAGMTPLQIAGQLQCSEKNVYTCWPRPLASSSCRWSRHWICPRT